MPHPRITYLLGSSTSPEIVARVKALLSPGLYLVVEDTHFNGNPILPRYGPGPTEAVQEFLSSGARFVPDRSREKFLLTFNPGGYLKRLQ